MNESVPPGGMEGQWWSLASGDMAQDGNRLFVVSDIVRMQLRLIKEKAFGRQEHLFEALGQRLKTRICDHNRLHTISFFTIRRKKGPERSVKLVTFW